MREMPHHSDFSEYGHGSRGSLPMGKPGAFGSVAALNEKGSA